MNTQKSLLGYFVEAYESYRAERCVAALEDARPRQPGHLGRILRWLTPNGGTLLLIAALILTQQVWARPLTRPAAPGPSATTVNYQGRLADSSGITLEGTYGMSFSLWDAATDGNLVWGPENHAAVPVSQGLFSVGLGSQTSGGIPTSAWNGDRYLEITVGGETLSPRELIRSVPIAGMALTVPDGAVNNRQLSLTRYVFNDSVPDHFELTASEQVLGQMTIDISYPATYLTFLRYAANGHGGRSLVYLRDENSTNLCSDSHTSSDVLGVSRTCMFDLPAGVHTFRLSARTASSTPFGQEVRNAQVIMIPIAQVP